MKKYLCIVFLVFSFLVIVLDFGRVYASLPLTGKVIVIDPGHGGKDPGTSYKNIYEKDINLKISLYLEEELNKMGASVILTRDGDYDLSNANAIWRKKSDFDNRIKLINESSVDLYLSIHLNYLEESKYSGLQIFYNKDNRELAEVMQKYLNDKLGGDREIKQIPKSTYMYGKLKPPGVLIECGFLSNYQERKLLNTKEYQKKLAKHIAGSLVNYYNI